MTALSGRRTVPSDTSDDAAALRVVRRCAAAFAGLATVPVLAAGMVFFHGTFEEALQQARSTDKKVFVDVYTQWCGPCKIMDANVFPDTAVGRYFNARFVNFKLDAEDEAVDGPAIAQRYEVGAYPTLLFLDAGGGELGRGVAGLDSEQLLALAEQVVDGVDSGFDAMRTQYASGDRNRDFVREYLRAAKLEAARAHADTDFEARLEHRSRMAEVFDGYFEASDKATLINPKDFEIIASYKDKVGREDPAVDFVVENYSAFTKAVPENAVAAFVLESNYYQAQGLALAGDATYRDYLDRLEGELAPAAELQRALDPESPLLREVQEQMFSPMYLAATGDWQGLHSAYEARLAEPGAELGRIYSSAASALSRADDPGYRRIALEYAQKAHELRPDDPFVALTYARLLEETGARGAAAKVLEDALAGLPERYQNMADSLEGALAQISGAGDAEEP